VGYFVLLVVARNRSSALVKRRGTRIGLDTEKLRIRMRDQVEREINRGPDLFPIRLRSRSRCGFRDAGWITARAMYQAPEQDVSPSKAHDRGRPNDKIA